MRKSKFIACCLLMVAFAPAARGQDSAPTVAPAIEPRAMALLEAMNRRLADARTLSFTALAVYDIQTAEKTPIFLTTMSDIAFKRPNQLRVATIGDGPAFVFVADGTNMARIDQPARTLAPQGIEALLRSAHEHGLDLPFADVLLDKPFGDLAKGVTSAFVVGQSRLVGGVTTNIVSVSDGASHMQLWIGADDNLPRQVWVSEPRDATRNMVSYSNWAVNKPLRDRLFSAAAFGRLRQVDMTPRPVPE
jgi:hypothetical protein